MPGHFTYEGFNENDDLHQGDILEPSEDLRAILRKVHPHFLDPKYKGFVILTQTCDLVRRNGSRCSAKHVSLAVIRELDSVLNDFLEHYCERVANTERIYTSDSKGRATEFLRRLFNQNEQNLGLFYLHPDADSGVFVESVILLRVSITLRIEHYDRLIKARVGRLPTEFVPKLGWLTRNLYSRVGTRDWEEAELKNLTRKFLFSGGGNEPIWVPRKSLLAAMKAGVDPSKIDPKEVIPAMERFKPTEPKEQALKAVSEAMAKQLPKMVRALERDRPENLEDWLKPHIENVCNRVRSNQLFTRSLKKE